MVVWFLPQADLIWKKMEKKWKKTANIDNRKTKEERITHNIFKTQIFQYFKNTLRRITEEKQNNLLRKMKIQKLCFFFSVNKTIFVERYSYVKILATSVHRNWTFQKLYFPKWKSLYIILIYFANSFIIYIIFIIIYTLVQLTRYADNRSNIKYSI